jgi:tRNA pseudouridine32 synthase / 23S rRNA pseudouridine746 synthase
VWSEVFAATKPNQSSTLFSQMLLIPDVIHADEALLVIDKPAGLLSLPDGHDATLPHVRRILEPQFGRLWIVHRLDRETSGIMLLARNEDAHRRLNQQFENRQVSKSYHAIVNGNPGWDEIRANFPLRINVGRRKRTAVVRKQGKPATTYFRLLESFDEHTLLEARPETGRRHQIRAHLFHLGYPILSDPLYGLGGISPLISRLALHANSLTFQDPTTADTLTFKCASPPDFEAAISNLHN